MIFGGDGIIRGISDRGFAGLAGNPYLPELRSRERPQDRGSLVEGVFVVDTVRTGC